MTHRHWQTVTGIVEHGHQVASGSAANCPYPSGTIEMQMPFFAALGLDLTEYFKGTLNISINPRTFQLTDPELTFRQVEWTDRHPPEDFSFSRCRVLFQTSTYNSWIYYPHPETKKRNFQNPSIIEIIAPPIPNIKYGDRVKIEYNPLEVSAN
ncbi:hypothetical protein H6F59_10480 [Nodosilinea sp. FACHB-141]|uniref:Multiubiquitin domain-containing protein n=2 Tax=Leptolyngbya TaxID=47251 RepID=A0ABV0JYM9_9CYAN|nr:hypothetical protein [Nodosilinea sp. FACHB-141]MBD2112257.1 hypothetical protein [Nodosilinea sp. FACHB-141]